MMIPAGPEIEKPARRLANEGNWNLVQGSARCKALTCRAARLYPRALTGLQKAKSPTWLTQGFVCLAALFAFAPEHT